MEAIGEIHEYSTAEFLAREDEFSQSSLAPYLEQARAAIYGADSGLDDATVARVRLHRLLLEDNEAEFLAARPNLAAEFANANEYQIAMTSSPNNLDHFMEHGIDYAFDTEKLDYARGIAADADNSAMQALMREKLLTLSGFDEVSMNFIFHDALDHAWLFNFMREHGLHQKYADFIDAAGDPFKGHLMSRESELLSGIGFTSRRFLSDEDYYGSLAMGPENLSDLLQTQSTRDEPRVKDAIEYITDNEAAASWAGFVVKATISNLILQRERWGGAKELIHTADGYKSTGNILSLTDPRYLALIVETTRLLAEHKDEYMTQEVALTATAEGILQKFLDVGAAAGSIAIIQSVSFDDKNAMKTFGMSTNHFPNNANG